MSFTSLFYHIVFSTKDRRPFLSAELLPRTCRYVGGIARNLKSQVMAANGGTDHLHLAAILHSTVALSEFVGKVKSNSSRWLHETVPGLGAFGWQDGDAAFTVSKSVLPKVVAYIDSQQEHHQRTTFKEELVALLERHGIEYDQDYIWR